MSDLEQTAIERLKLASDMSLRLFRKPRDHVEPYPPEVYAAYPAGTVLLRGKGRFIATGVRWAESVARKKNRGTLEVLHSDRKKSLILANDNDEDRRLFETCQMKGKRVVNPIVDWNEADVLDYVAVEKIPMNPLYCEGFRRVGCVGCPMAGGKTQAMEFARYPKIKAAYIRSFDRMLEMRKKRELPGQWRSGVDVFHWWMEDGVLPGQEVLDGF